MEKSPADALAWYRKAAEQGHSRAQAKLGNCLLLGEGAAVDYPEAAKWLKLAAENGDSLAQRRYGVCFERGWGGKKLGTNGGLVSALRRLGHRTGP